MVYVQNLNGEPLMPTTRNGKVRRMLKKGLATVVQTEPFVIRLNYETSNKVQDITLGVDAGVSFIGLSATSKDREYYSAEVHPRTDISRLISERRDYRHDRRIKKVRHRKNRIKNRGKVEGWIPPSTNHCIDTHIQLVRNVSRILPVKSLVIEVGQFDIRKIQNPEVSGVDYQKGEQYGFWNVREYVFFRDRHTCAHCKGKSKDKILNVHHIVSRRVGGDSPSNLITLCETCHKAYHRGEFELKIKREESLKGPGTMSVMRWKLYHSLKSIYKDIRITHRFTTKSVRIRNGLKKGHAIDARCISGNPTAVPSVDFLYIKQVRRHNRKIHKSRTTKGGVRKLNQAPYLVKGFRLFDKVLYDNQKCFVFGRRSRGYFDLRTLDGTRIHPCAKTENIKLLCTAKRFLVETIKRQE